MKNFNLQSSFIISCLLLVSSISFAQNIKFSYDATGNRVSTLIVSKEVTKSASEDTLLPKALLSLTDANLENIKIAIFPNPTTDIIQLQTDGILEDMDIEAYLISSKGELLCTFKINSPRYKVDLTQYTAGLYFLKIPINDKVESWKIIKQ